MPTVIRASVGLLVGLGAGLALTVLVVLTKFGPLVNTPRALHGILLVALVLIPAAGGAVVGATWRKS